MNLIYYSIAAFLFVIGNGYGQNAAGVPKEKTAPFPFKEAESFEIKQLDSLVGHEDWVYRVFGLLRLERYTGDETHAYIKKALEDKDWHVRCFALRAAVRIGYAVPEDLLQKEDDHRVVRLALQLGIPIPKKTVDKVMRRCFGSGNLDRMIVGVEISAATKDPVLRKAGEYMLKRLAGGLTDVTTAAVGSRLGLLLETPNPRMLSVSAWRQVLQADGVKLGRLPVVTAQTKAEKRPVASSYTKSKFDEISGYLHELKRQKIDVVVVVDATGSMGSVLQRARAQIDRLIKILNDLSKSMRFGVVAYRDVNDGQTTQRHPLTDRVDYVRAFLYKIKPEGGGDFPESVLSGLKECPKIGWLRDSEKQIVIVGDAPSHEKDMKAVEAFVDGMKQYSDIHTHTVIVGTVPQTTESFQKIAKWGDGRSCSLGAEDDLAKTIMRFSIDEDITDVFDEFYDLYVKLCL